MSESRRVDAGPGGTWIVLVVCFALLAQLFLPALHSATCSVTPAPGLVAHAHAHDAPTSDRPAVSDRAELHACGLCEVLAQPQPPLLSVSSATCVALLEPSTEQVVVASTTLIGRTLLASSARAPPLA